MNISVEATCGGVGIIIGAISNTHPKGEWFIQAADVWVFLWPVIYGGLMAFGAHVAKRIIIKLTNKKNKNENETT